MRNQQEIHEAINAADDAIKALHRAQDSLSGASNWGIVDMLGGGFITSLLKHGKIKRAQEEINEAQARLQVFRNELADIGRVADFGIDISDFLRFADYFFDDFFSDIMIQSKISNGKQQISMAINRVEAIRRQLWSMLD